MYQHSDLCFFDYSGLTERQKEKINNILYRPENEIEGLSECFENSHESESSETIPNVLQSGTTYPMQPQYPISPYTMPSPGMHPVIPQYPMVIRYPNASPAIVLNTFVPYQYMGVPPTSASIAMFMPPNHLLSSPYQYPCALPQGVQTTAPLNHVTSEETFKATPFQKLAEVSGQTIDLKEGMAEETMKGNKSLKAESEKVQLKDNNNSSSCIAKEESTTKTSKPSLSEGTPEPKKQSWASLLRNTRSANEAIVITSCTSSSKPLFKQNVESKQERKDSINSLSADNLMPNNSSHVNGNDDKFRLISFLRTHKMSHKSPSLLPRGLMNRTNWCYVNSTLQALLACPPFYHLIKSLNQFNSSMWDVLNLPVIKSLVRFFNEFEAIQVKAPEKFTTAKGQKFDIRKGIPFEPDFVYSMLQSIDYGAFKMNQQEDAEEFLSCILNKLHEEMVQILKLDRVETSTSAPQVDSRIPLESESWQQVRSKNRTANSVNPTSLESSPVSNIFRGQICSILQCPGQKDSTSLQPFFTLQLDVQSDKVKSVHDALEQFVSKESLVDYTCNHSKAEVDATQRTLLESLPSVLVLHLKWFTYNKDGGLQKNSKKFDLDVNLEITKDLLSSHAKSRSTQNHRKYKLFAVVNHIGHRAVGGHYIVDVFHAGYSTWLRCDDDNISPVTQQQVLGFNRPNVPYLVFYRRIDATS